MASALPKPVPVKRLGELLQEKQEPFLLDAYLLEKGYSKRALNSKGRNSYGFKSSKTISHCPKIFKSVLTKFVSANNNPKSSNFDSRAYEDGRFRFSEISGKTQQKPELDRFSSASSMTVFDSCSESDTEQESTTSHSQQNPKLPTSEDTFKAFKHCNLRDQEADTDRTHRSGCVEGSKQHSPVSVLEELPFDEARFCSRRNEREIPSTSSLNLPKKVTDDSIFSASLFELLVNSLLEKQSYYVGGTELQGVLGIASASPYLKTKRALEQTKQLLFDCVREVVATHGRKGRKQCVHEFLGAEELGKIICEKICLLGKQSGNLTNITQLINSDFCDSIEEWSNFQPQIREIEMDIVDAILEEIRNEIVIDMNDCFVIKRC